MEQTSAQRGTFPTLTPTSPNIGHLKRDNYHVKHNASASCEADSSAHIMESSSLHSLKEYEVLVFQKSQHIFNVRRAGAAGQRIGRAIHLLHRTSSEFRAFAHSLEPPNLPASCARVISHGAQPAQGTG